MKRFNVNGICYKDKHYMVNLDSRLEQIKEMVDNGDYFAINRARQYGKTTTLYWLEKYLEDEYYVISVSFEGVGDAYFSDEKLFAQGFLHSVDTIIKYTDSICGLRDLWMRDQEIVTNMEYLSAHISSFCQQCDRPVVLMIDEVDKSSDNQLFLSFLGMLRNKYLNRSRIPTFHSVILAGLYDIKNLKLKLRPEEEHKYNSPWNIAADFDIDMSFSVSDIEGMLKQYEQEHETGMNIPEIAGLIYDYTSGYPFLVSRICKLMDEKIVGKKIEEFHEGMEDNSVEKVVEFYWDAHGIREAVKMILNEKNTLFDDMMKKLEDYRELRDMLYAILFQGKRIPYNQHNHVIEIGELFGLVKANQGVLVITNRIFETILYNLFMSEEIMNSDSYEAALLDRNQFIENGHLNMERVLEKFTEHFTDVYGDCSDSFVEENGRRFFLLYLKPIINGVGNYYVEARTRDMRRTDVIIDYRGEQFVVELKIWHGDEYNRRGEEQLAGYLDAYHLDRGYMLSFNFNKNKQTGVKVVRVQDKEIVEAVV